MVDRELINGRIAELAEQMKPIALEEMSGIKLMNRTDTKFVTNKQKLVQLLEMAQGQYYSQQIGESRIAEYVTTYWDTDNY